MKGVTYTTTKQLLINTALPELTRTYKPVSHQEVMDLTLNSIYNAGYILDKESYQSTSEGQVAVGRYTIKSVADSEMQLQIAWLNSYNRTKKLTWGLGVQVFICQNGVISADMGSFKKKHQGEIQEYTPRAITEYIKQAEDVFTKLQVEREQMKQVEIDPRIISTLLGRMFYEEEFITSTQLNIIKRELSVPSFDYGCSNSLWNLYQDTTFSLKDIHPSLWMKNHLAAHQFFSEASDMLTTIHVQAEPESVFPIPLALRDTMAPIEDPRVKQLSLYD